MSDDELDQECLLQAAIWEELHFLHGTDYRLIQELKGKLRLPTIDTTLFLTDCNNLDALLRNKNLKIHLRIAGFAFLKQLTDDPQPSLLRRTCRSANGSIILDAVAIRRIHRSE